jgi:hypothetical protein
MRIAQLVGLTIEQRREAMIRLNPKLRAHQGLIEKLNR